MDRVVETRRDPRISVNKLGEYLTATPVRRKRIIHDAKFPSTFMVSRYVAAENAIADWICSGGTDELMLTQAIAALRTGEPRSSFARSRRDCCVTAIARAARLQDKLRLPNGRVTYVRANSATPLSLGELTVSVRPEVLLYVGGGDQRRLGGIKLYFSKQHPLDQQAADFISTLLWQSLVIRAAKDFVLLDPEQIKVVDVLAGEVYMLPKTYKQRLKEIAAAGEEIAERWNAIQR